MGSISQQEEITGWMQELKRELPQEWQDLLKKRDSSSLLLPKLLTVFSLEAIASDQKAQRTWELIGLYYLNSKRFYEALSIFYALYQMFPMLLKEDTKSTKAHEAHEVKKDKKGTWMHLSKGFLDEECSINKMNLFVI